MSVQLRLSELLMILLTLSYAVVANGQTQKSRSHRASEKGRPGDLVHHCFDTREQTGR
jgi:hypothetical protein